MVGNWQENQMIWMILISALPAVAAGLSEDLGYRVSPNRRLMFAALSAALASYLLGVWVTRGDLLGLDTLMSIAPIATALTIAASAGFSHAVNLIDGMNGLSFVVLSSAAVALGVVAYQHGLNDAALLAWLIAAGVLGFMVFNWLGAKLFLGDAGAYRLGHVLIWVAFYIAAKAPNVSIAALFLILFWPFADTIHTIGRRAVGCLPICQPDRLHLHQKIRRVLEIKWVGRKNRVVSNPLATAVLPPMILAPVIAGVMLSSHPLTA